VCACVRAEQRVAEMTLAGLCAVDPGFHRQVCVCVCVYMEQRWRRLVGLLCCRSWFTTGRCVRVCLNNGSQMATLAGSVLSISSSTGRCACVCVRVEQRSQITIYWSPVPSILSSITVRACVCVRVWGQR
jgi:hypothetical protein